MENVSIISVVITVISAVVANFATTPNDEKNYNIDCYNFINTIFKYNEERVNSY